MSLIDVIKANALGGSGNSGGSGGNSAELAELKANGGVGYTETVVTEILPETTFNFQPVEDFGGLCATTIPKLAPVVEYKTYTVDWNGTEYNCKCELNMIGNLAIADMGDDTGEPFAIAFDEEAGVCMVVSASSGEVTYSVKQIEEIVHAIDGKYQSIDCFYELTTENFTDVYVSSVLLNEADAKAINAIFARSDMMFLRLRGNNHVFAFCGGWNDINVSGNTKASKSQPVIVTFGTDKGTRTEIAYLTGSSRDEYEIQLSINVHYI